MLKRIAQNVTAKLLRKITPKIAKLLTDSKNSLALVATQDWRKIASRLLDFSTFAAQTFVDRILKKKVAG